MSAIAPGRGAPHEPVGRGVGRRGRSRLVVAGLAALLAALVLAVATPAGRYQLALSFTRLPAPFVELYFPNDPPAALVGHLLVAEIVVATHEGGAGSYPYEAQLRDATGTVVATGGGSLTVAADDQVSRTLRLAVPPRVTWSSVQISLVGRDESVHYTNPAVRPP